MVMIDDKSFSTNFLNVPNSPYLKYNIFSVNIIEEAGYSVLVKNRKKWVFDNENKVVIV